MNSKQRVLTTLDHQISDRMPIDIWTSDPIKTSLCRYHGGMELKILSPVTGGTPERVSAEVTRLKETLGQVAVTFYQP